MKFSGTKGQAELLRILAQHLGIRGCWHGWLMQGGKAVCQGWAAFWRLACSRRWIVPYSGAMWSVRGAGSTGVQLAEAAHNTNTPPAAQCGGFRHKTGDRGAAVMSRSIRGNTGALYQEVAQSASQIAGPLFDDSTGTLERRIRHCIDNPISGGIALTPVQVKQLREQLDVLARGEM